MSANYLLEVANRYPLLTAEQEIQLGRAIRAWQDYEGGPDQAPPAVQRRGQRALDTFVLSNLRLAHYVARRYTDRGVAMEDLMQAATEGLLGAYKRFDPTLGYRSSSYAVWWAQQACQVLVAQQGSGLRLPTTVSERIRKVTRATQRLIGDLGRMPTSAEIEEACDLAPGQLQTLKAARKRADVLSLHGSLVDHEDGPLPRFLVDAVEGDSDPQAQLERDEVRQLLRSLINTHSAFTPQQRVLLQCRYLNEKPPTLARLASELNMNRETCRRLERGALQTLRELLPCEIEAYRDLL